MKKRRMRKHIFSNTAACFLIVITAVLILNLFFTQILPLQFTFPLVLALIFTSLIVSVYHIKYKKTKPIQIFSTILVVSLIGLILFANCVVIKIPATLKEVTSLSKVSKESAAVYIMKNKNAENLKHLDGSVMGMMKEIDPKTAKAMERALKKEKVQFQTKEYNSTMRMVQDLYDGKVASIAMNCNYADLIEENEMYKDFKKDVRSVYTLDFKKHHSLQVNENLTFEEEVPRPITMYVYQKGSIHEDILLTIHPQKNKINIVEIPSNYYLKIESTTHKDKFDQMKNIHLLGLDVCKESIEKALNVPIDYVLQVNYGKMQELIQACGGLDMNGKHYKANEAVEYLKQNPAKAWKALQEKITKPTTVFRYCPILKTSQDVYSTNMPIEAIKQWVRYQMANEEKWNYSEYELQGYITKKHCNQLGIETSVITPNLDSVQEARTKIEEIRN